LGKNMNWFRKIFPKLSGNTDRRAEILKTITWRGGVVSFRIPAHWTEDYTDEGRGTFYDDAPNSGTFRLDIVTAQAPSPLTSDSAREVLATLRQSAKHPIERLSSGSALVRYSESAVDRGHKLLITYWSVAHVIPPNHARIATFSFTILAHQRDEPRFQRELELLDREVRESVFSETLGIP
jgi:hypothetical protein